jgi:hypothetical protein
MEVILALGVGLGLAAACGLRVFAPLLVLGLAAHFRMIHLAPGFAWLCSTPGLTALGAATAIEITAYYVPWLDHALDALATPAALMAGALAAVAVLGDLPPWLRWSVGLIAGGSLAGLAQGGSVLLRLKSLALTGGLANPVVATVEWVGAVGLAVVAVMVPLAALALVVALVAFAARLGRLAFARRPARGGGPGANPVARDAGL